MYPFVDVHAFQLFLMQVSSQPGSVINSLSQFLPVLFTHTVMPYPDY